MSRALAAVLLLASSSYAAHSQVPARFRGTWAMDSEATIKAVDALSPPLSPERRAQMDRELPQIAASAAIRVTSTTMTMLQDGADVGSFSLTLQEKLDERTVFDAGKLGTATLQLNGDGLLNISVSSDDDMDVMWWKWTGTEGTEAELPNSGVAFLDGLKSCSPGVFQISYPGFGSSKNTIMGREGDRCDVRIEHRQVTLICSYSEATISLLTTEAKYEDARNGALSGSTDSEESRRAAEECVPE